MEYLKEASQHTSANVSHHAVVVVVRVSLCRMAFPSPFVAFFSWSIAP